jgi:hypothetical protein
VENTTTGYENIYLSLLPELAVRDLASCSPDLGAVFSGGVARVSFLGREYVITNEGVSPADGSPVDVNYLSVLVYYFISGGFGELSGDFAPLHRLTGMIDGQRDLTDDFQCAPLIRKFGNDGGRLNAAVTRIGGVELDDSPRGKRIWQLYALPKILAQIVLYEADEEFPTDIQILFDRFSPRFLNFECLAVLTGCMIHSLVEAAEN